MSSKITWMTGKKSCLTLKESIKNNGNNLSRQI